MILNNWRLSDAERQALKSLPAMRIFKYPAMALLLTAGAAAVGGDEPGPYPIAPPPAELGGIGVELGTKGSNIVVMSIVPDSPAAAQKGIHVGDWIMAVAQDNEPAVQIQSGNLKQAQSLIRGPRGTTVRLTIVPLGEDDPQPRVVSLLRGELKLPWGDGVLLTKGTRAPDIEMAVLANGTSERLSHYAGKIVVLEFWASWCGPCQKAMADLQSYSGEHPDWKDKVVIIAASIDTNGDAATQHLKAKGWNQTHNVWVRNDAIKAYHVDGIPTAYVIDQQGKIVASGPHPWDIPEIVNHEVQTRQRNEAK